MRKWVGVFFLFGQAGQIRDSVALRASAHWPDSARLQTRTPANSYMVRPPAYGYHSKLSWVLSICTQCRP